MSLFSSLAGWRLRGELEVIRPALVRVAVGGIDVQVEKRTAQLIEAELRQRDEREAEARAAGELLRRRLGEAEGEVQRLAGEVERVRRELDAATRYTAEVLRTLEAAESERRAAQAVLEAEREALAKRDLFIAEAVSSTSWADGPTGSARGFHSWAKPPGCRCLLSHRALDLLRWRFVPGARGLLSRSRLLRTVKETTWPRRRHRRSKRRRQVSNASRRGSSRRGPRSPT